jgi:hypothetical protein
MIFHLSPRRREGRILPNDQTSRPLLGPAAPKCQTIVCGGLRAHPTTTLIALPKNHAVFAQAALFFARVRSESTARKARAIAMIPAKISGSRKSAFTRQMK